MIRHSVSRLDRWMITSPVDILSIHLSVDDYVASALMGLAVFVWIQFGAFPATVPAAILSSVYAGLLFLVYRRIIPVALTAHAVDMIRYRYAFLALCAAGTLVVVSSSAFRASFGSAGAESVSRLVALVTLMLVIRYFSRGGRRWLFAACFLFGALASQGAIAVMTLLAIALVVGYVRFKLARFDFAFSSEGLFGGGYVGEMCGLGRRLLAAMRVRVFCVLMAALGFLTSLLFMGIVLHRPLGGLSGLRGIVRSAADELGALVAGPTGFFLLITGVALFLALALSRRATDTRRDLPSGQMVLYALLFALPFLRISGILHRLPPFGGRWMPETSILPDGFLAGVLVISGAVFLIELCNRELETSERSEDCLTADDPESRPIGSLRRSPRAIVALLYSAAVLGSVIYLVGEIPSGTAS